ncbi:hypothetical protein OESDEN_00012 [Oesophagostomum dentatum]|uniref:Uncharacterized protein n=1 Tax=Oesophagostomum dentatum TaxID=61180 RepID=A0A0B1TRN8_OESDE|nr:hypothetical protein OESDEN_00012 [Oesophagostomum dentatum]
MKSYHRMFTRRCNSDAEFSSHLCEVFALPYISFIFRYVNSTDVYEPQRAWTCAGEHPQIAFRACRQSCGFCNFTVVNYSLENALNACKVSSQ